MSQPVRDRLEHLSRRVSQSIVLRGGSLIVTVGLGSACVAGLVDWLVHVDDAGVRFLFALGILAATAWIAFRYVVSPLLDVGTDTGLALQAERRFPQLRDLFASSAAFARAEVDPRSGSPALQRRTIAEAERRLNGLSLESIVPTGPARTATLAAIAVCVLVATLGAVRPLETGTALHRLLLPFGAPEWPRQTQLSYVDAKLNAVTLDPDRPLRRAQGETLELFVVNDLGELPESVVLETRVDGTVVASKPLRRVKLADASSEGFREACKIVLPIDKSGIAFRVVGGDDRDQLFQPIDVLPPPEIESIRVTLHPPAHLGRPSTELPEGVGHVSAVVGTRVDVVARTKAPVVGARLHVRDRAPVEIELAEDGRAFETSFTLEESGTGSYWLQVVDSEGLENLAANRYEIRAAADRLPEVSITRPETDLRVTRTARVPLEIVARDDFGLSRVVRAVRVDRADGTRMPTSRIPLWSRPEDGEESHDRVELRSVVDLAEWDVQPGDRVVVHVEALDSAPAEEPETSERVGRSVPRALIVVTNEDKVREVVGDQAVLEGELESAAENQRRVHERTLELGLQWESVGRLRPEDLDQLESAELEQRRIASRLVDPNDGVLPRARALLSTLEANGIDDPEIRRGLESIVDELAQLEEHDLPDAESGLTEARKLASLDEDEERAEAGREAVERATAGQRRVLASLDELTGRLARGRGRRELELDLDALVAGQRELRNRTAAIVERTFARRFGELTEQDRAELEKIAAGQRSRADEAERLQRRLGAAAESAGDDAPLVRDAADLLAERATAAGMESVVEQLRPRDPSDVVRAGAALAEQERLLGDLADVRSALDDRVVSDAETLVKRLREIEDEFEELHREQAEVLRKTEEAENLANPGAREEALEELRKRQETLRRKASRLARRARRLQAGAAADAAERAGDRMDDALRLRKEDEAERRRELQREVLDDLEQARDEAARARKRAEERLARELLETVADDLKGVLERQRGLVGETERLRDAIAERGGKPSRAMARTLAGLADVQSALAGETDELAERLAAAEVFVFALEGTSRLMTSAAERLGQRLADDRTLTDQRNAIERLEALLAVLEEKESPPEGDPGEDVPSEQPNDNPSDELVSGLAQLKLLRSLQRQLLDRTARLDELRRNEDVPAADRDAELEAITAEQERLTALARELLKGLAGGEAEEHVIDEDPNE